MAFDEGNYENSVIELFKGMGYTYLYGPDVVRDFYDPLYESELIGALYRINPDLPEEAIQDALFKLKNFENAELVQKNQLFMDYLQNGIQVRFSVNGEETSDIVYIVDYKNPENNSFIGKPMDIYREQQQTPGHYIIYQWFNVGIGRVEISVKRRNRCFGSV